MFLPYLTIAGYRTKENCMDSAIRIIDADNVASIDWPSNEEADHTRKYVVPLIENGPLFYMDNAHVTVTGIMVDDILMPLVLAERNYNDSNVCSIYTHYVKYALEKIDKLDNRLLAWLMKTCSLPFAMAMKAGRVDKVVYVNNWLFTTNPSPALSGRQVEAVTSVLTHKYPGHAIVFRSVNTCTGEKLFDSLRNNGYRMIRSRRIYILNPAAKAYLKNKTVRYDRNLSGRMGYEVIDASRLTASDVPLLTKLYRDLYLQKHSSFNPQLKDAFFHLILKERILEITVLRKDGRIDSFSSFYSNKKVMISGVGGYNTEIPLKVGLNRQDFSAVMDEAKRRKQLLNLSAGSGLFKMRRGAEPCIEYDAVYDGHLPYRQRIGWFCLKFIMDMWQYAASFLFRKRKP